MLIKLIGLLIYTLLAFLLISPSVFSSETLVIKLKNGSKDSIPLPNELKSSFDWITGVEESDDLSFSLIGAYPNPSSEYIYFEFNLPKAGEVKIKIYDSKGIRVREITQNGCSAGDNCIEWDGKDSDGEELTTGTYFFEVVYENIILTDKIIIVR